VTIKGVKRNLGKHQNFRLLLCITKDEIKRTLLKMKTRSAVGLYAPYAGGYMKMLGTRKAQLPN